MLCVFYISILAGYQRYIRHCFSSYMSLNKLWNIINTCRSTSYNRVTLPQYTSKKIHLTLVSIFFATLAASAQNQLKTTDLIDTWDCHSGIEKGEWVFTKNGAVIIKPLNGIEYKNIYQSAVDSERNIILLIGDKNKNRISLFCVKQSDDSQLLFYFLDKPADLLGKQRKPPTLILKRKRN